MKFTSQLRGADFDCKGVQSLMFKMLFKHVLLLVMLCGSGFYSQLAYAQQSAPETVQHRVGLIDMAEVFNGYEKFTAMKEALQKEIEASDTQAKAKMELIQQLQAQLTSGNLETGSADFQKIEAQLLQSQTELESFRRVAQRDFLRKEADVYKAVYLEAQDAVTQYAKYYNYTLILRFNREDVKETTNPRDIINGMNRQVIYYRGQDDITEPILKYINGEWRKQQTATRPTPPTR